MEGLSLDKKYLKINTIVGGKYRFVDTKLTRRVNTFYYCKILYTPTIKAMRKYNKTLFFKFNYERGGKL
jgi:hypothetical protein|tara:strand:- start:299 stop:505 length:207 start_codon:yes stop_codon:yes gene_type:complete